MSRRNGRMSLAPIGDAPPTAVADPRALNPENLRFCEWCRRPMPGAKPGQVFHSRKCRQAAFRIRRRLKIEVHNEKPLRFAYLDPPYPGLAWMYKDQSTYRGEVDHQALIEAMKHYDGWALSTSARALATILPLCPQEARVCAWVKPIGAWSKTFGIHNCWEPLIVVAGRSRRPGKRDWLSAQPARKGGSDLLGRKPEAFCTWMFELLGMQPGDQLDDLFPGSGIVGRAWKEVNRAAGVASSCQQQG